MKNKKTIFLIIAVILVLGILVYFFLLGRDDSDSNGKDDSKSQGDITIVEQSEILEFDANLNRNAEKYSETVMIEDLEVVHTKYDIGVPIIRTKYDAEDKEMPMEWLVEYITDDEDFALEKGDIITIVGKFEDAFRSYQDQEDEDMLWTISFVAEEVTVQE